MMVGEPFRISKPQFLLLQSEEIKSDALSPPVADSPWL